MPGAPFSCFVTSSEIDYATMMRSFHISVLLLCSSLCLSVKIVKSQRPAGPSARAIPDEVQRVESHVDQVIERAEAYFKQGKLNWDDNKRALARDDFDKAVDEILMSGMGKCGAATTD